MKKMMALGLATALTATTLAGCGGGQEADVLTCSTCNYCGSYGSI